MTLFLTFCVLIPLSEEFFYRFFGKLIWGGFFGDVLLSLSCALTAFAGAVWVFEGWYGIVGVAGATFVFQFFLIKLKGILGYKVSLGLRVGVGVGLFGWLVFVVKAYFDGVGLMQPGTFDYGDR